MTGNHDKRTRVFPLAGAIVAATLAVLAGCAKPPPPPPPPPPPVVVIPPKPTPPMGAPPEMTVPSKTEDGTRHTVNYGISTAQAVWNFRSGYNVAALNCVEAEYLPILDGYKRFLKVYDKSLDQASKDIDASFRTQHTGRAAIVARETYQTQVYNFFSLPPVDSGFCKAAMEVSAELLTVDPTQFDSWSYTGLAKLEAPFKAFFDAYDQYRADLAAWQARYGSNGLITVRPSAEQAMAQPTANRAAVTATVAQPVVQSTAPAVQSSPTAQLAPAPQPAPASQPVTASKPAMVQVPVVQPTATQSTATQPAAAQPRIVLPGERIETLPTPDQPRIVLPQVQ